MHQRQAAPAGAQALAGFEQAQAEQRAVGQAGQFVVMGQVAQAFLGLTTLRQIAEEGHHVADLAAAIEHAVELQPLWIKRPVLARLHQFALPAPVLLQRLVDRAVMPPGIQAARQFQGVATQQFVAAVAGHAAERLVQGEQFIVGAEDGDAFAGRLEDRRRQPLLLFLGAPRADIAAGPDHPQHPALAVALHRPATVLDPAPVAVVVAEAVFDAVVLGAALEVFDQGALERQDIVRVQPRLEVYQHGLDRLRVKAEQLAQLGVVDFVGLQVPVPQAQLAGLQGQGQALFTFAQGLAGRIQLGAALRNPGFQPGLGLAQLLLGATALVDFIGQRLVELLAAAMGGLQVLDQRLVLKAPQQAVLDQAVDLPGHHQQGPQQ